MKKYLIIEKNTMSRESISALIYQLDKDSVVYESESLAQSKNLIDHHQAVDFIIFNSIYKYINHTDLVAKIKQSCPKSKIILVIQNTEHVDIQVLLDKGAHSIITINSTKSEVIAAIKSLKHEQQFIGQHVQKLSEDTNSCKSSEKLPIMKNKFASEIRSKLTNRQCEVLDFMVKGYANKLIAYELGVSEGTIKLHVSSILRALKVTNRTEAAMRAGQYINSHAH